MIGIIVALLLILLIIGIVLFVKEKKRRVLKDPNYITVLNGARDFLDVVESQREMYFTFSTKERLKAKYHENNRLLQSNPIFLKFDVDEVLERFRDTYNNLDEYVKTWNEEYVANELEVNKGFFSDVDGKSLDFQQRKAVVIEEDNNLVIAGAGSGKTLTITGKVKYLVKRKNVNANEILLLSFTKKSAGEN